MTIFQLIKTVLDEIYGQIEEPVEGIKDQKIKEKLEYLSDHYNKLLTSSVTIDYKDPATRFAYIYKYVTCHANLVYNELYKISELFQFPQIVISCIGGGPGSDFLGILKFMMRTGCSSHIRCFLLDKEDSWNDSWYDVDNKLEVNFRITTICEKLNVTNRDEWCKKKKILDSDLYTMIYFMSEIHHYMNHAKEFFEHLFENAKPGSKFLYIDNNYPGFYNWFGSLISRFKLNMISSEEKRIPIYDCDEEKKDLGEYLSKFGSPKLKPDVAVRVCEKV